MPTFSEASASRGGESGQTLTGSESSTGRRQPGAGKGKRKESVVGEIIVVFCSGRFV